MSLRTPLARVRHLGSAKDGTHHWWVQRLTALALIPLTIWFVASVISLVGAGHGAVVSWIGNPVSATLMLILIVAVFYHAHLGLQIVIEDYVHNKAAKLALLLTVQGLSLLLGTAAVLAVLTILL
jgi:succinate dehydrogenase / fumarate reductase membrane anchor subunit